MRNFPKVSSPIFSDAQSGFFLQPLATPRERRRERQPLVCCRPGTGRAVHFEFQLQVHYDTTVGTGSRGPSFVQGGPFSKMGMFPWQ
ncbi:hypothetical protein EMIT0P228_20034 [Pseudomonas brassicacearum]